MNILVFAHDSSLYGASQSLLTALDGVRKINNRKILVLLPHPGAMESKLSALNISYKVIPFPRCATFERTAAKSFIQKLKNLYSYYMDVLRVFPSLIKLTEENEIDLIYSNTSTISVGYMVAKKLKIPHVWHIREFGDLDFDLNYYPTRERITQMINHSTKCIFSTYVLKNHWIKIATDRSCIVLNGILKHIDLKLTSGRKYPNGVIRIGLLGLISKTKGQHIAIESFGALELKKANCELVIYGGGHDLEYFNNLQKLASHLNIEDRVFFMPFLDDRDFIYDQLDIVLNCSRMEGFGRTIVEAMGYGIPVIAHASGGVTEIIDDGVNGMLYDGSVGGLTECILKLITDKNLYESLSINGNRSAEKYSVVAYVAAIDKIFNEATAQSLTKS